LTGGLFRISAQNADALGIQKAAETKSDQSQSGQVSDEMVWTTLRTCYDPEIPVNIVDLGLVYDMKVSPLPSGRAAIAVKMTLTAPGCGMGSIIAGDAQQKLLELSGVE